MSFQQCEKPLLGIKDLDEDAGRMDGKCTEDKRWMLEPNRLQDKRS